jgi:hypothetical protein
MILDKHPTSIQLADGHNEALDKLAAKLTLRDKKRVTRADAHRLALSEGIAQIGATLDGPVVDISQGR